MAPNPEPSSEAHDDDATNQGVSAQHPAEGGDDTPDGDDGSPEG